MTSIEDGHIPPLETVTSLPAIVAGDGAIPFFDLAAGAYNYSEDFTFNGSMFRLGAGAAELDTMNIAGSFLLEHTATFADDHAIEIDVDADGFGDVEALDIDYATGAIADGQDEAVMLINIDETLATGGDVFGLEVLATDGDATIYGIKAGPLVGPVHQDSGVFVNPTTGTDNTASTDIAAMIDGNTGTMTAIFENDNEYILIGSAAAFEDIEFILTTEANISIKPTFWYSTAGSHQFTEFFPIDGTSGFRNTGVVSWDAADLTGHVANDDTGTFDIKIIRTRNNLNTTPILGYAKTAATTEYIWDKDGNVNLKNLTLAENLNLGTIALSSDSNILTILSAAGENLTLNLATSNSAAISSTTGVTKLFTTPSVFFGVGASPNVPFQVTHSGNDGFHILGGNHSINVIAGNTSSEKSLNFQNDSTLLWKIGTDNAPAGETDDFIIKDGNNADAEFRLQANDMYLNVADVHVNQFIKHAGDGDTYDELLTDQRKWFVGGEEFMRFTEAVTDVIAFNPAGAGDIDFEIWGTTDMVFELDAGNNECNITRLNTSSGRRRSRTTGGNVTVTTSMDYIGIIDSPTFARTVTFPASHTNGDTYIVADEGGGAGLNAITLATADADTINAGATVTIAANHGRLTVTSDGTNWHAS